MSKYITIQVPQPCHKNWDQMLPKQDGKFCLSCQKMVYDFSYMSDAELVAFFQKNKLGLCGRFQAGQLNRDLLIPKKPIPWIRYFFQFTLPALLLSLKATAQQTKGTPVIVVQSNQARPEISKQPKASGVTVKGSITDQDGRGIPFASIMLAGTRLGVQADGSGNFVFHNIPLHSKLIFSSVGFEAKEIFVHKESVNEKLILTMQPMISGFVGYIVVRSTRKKSRKKAQIQNQAQTPGVVVYPNPAAPQSLLKMKCAAIGDGNYVIEIINSGGVSLQSENLVKEKGAQELSLQLKKLPPGIYFLRMVHKTTGIIFTKEIFIQ